MFLHAHMRHTSPGRTLSHHQETLWERVWEGLKESVCKAVRWICVHHGCVRPRGRDSRSEQRVSTKEQQIQWRQSSTNLLLKWSRHRDEGWIWELCGMLRIIRSRQISYFFYSCNLFSDILYCTYTYCHIYNIMALCQSYFSHRMRLFSQLCVLGLQ